MILNHGNIRKSRLLRYMFLDNLPPEDHRKKCEEYRQTIEKDEFAEYLGMEKYLHDSRMSMDVGDLDIRMEFTFWNEKTDEEGTKAIILHHATVISWNKCRRSGHLSRMNRKIDPHRYGYSEFYTDNGNKYVSILVFTKPESRVDTGIYYPIVTIRYEKMTIEDA